TSEGCPPGKSPDLHISWPGARLPSGVGPARRESWAVAASAGRTELARTCRRVRTGGMSSIEITVIDREGVATPGIEWDDDESLMECLVRNKSPILASCGGNASCSTCYSYLDPESYEQAGEIDEDEADVLDSLMDDEREPTSRL